MKQITVGSHQFNLYWFTGKVLSATKNLETRVHGGGGGGQGSGYTAPVSFSSTTTVHDQLFLSDQGGAERAFQLQDFDVACRESNWVTVLWAMKAGQDKGRYVLVNNHTTQAVRFDDASIGKLVGPAWQLGCLGIGLAGLVLTVIIVLIFLGGVTQSAQDPMLHIIQLLYRLAMLFVGGVIAFFVVTLWCGSTKYKRVSQFKAAINVQEMPST